MEDNNIADTAKKEEDVMTKYYYTIKEGNDNVNIKEDEDYYENSHLPKRDISSIHYHHLGITTSKNHTKNNENNQSNNFVNIANLINNKNNINDHEHAEIFKNRKTSDT